LAIPYIFIQPDSQEKLGVSTGFMRIAFLTGGRNESHKTEGIFQWLIGAGGGRRGFG
jgi:hypothetical protein